MSKRRRRVESSVRQMARSMPLRRRSKRRSPRKPSERRTSGECFFRVRRRESWRRVRVGLGKVLGWKSLRVRLVKRKELSEVNKEVREGT